MMRGPDLYWLPRPPTWSQDLASAEAGTIAWPVLCALARVRIDALETRSLDRKRQHLVTNLPEEMVAPPIRLAVLASSTVDHLLPAIRVAGMRRDLWIETFTPDYGQHTRALIDPASPLYAFRPTAVLFAFDSRHLLAGIEPGDDAAEVEARITRIGENLATQWTRARQAFRCQVIQQTLLPVFDPLFGSNEHRLPGSPYWAIQQLNATLRRFADTESVDILALDAIVATDGLAAWHDPALWHRAKQEVHPSAAPGYGDRVVRLLAAALGRSSKALVLDLDNTLWGGVIGDDGLEGIKLGQGSALGEAFVAFQRYAHDLSRRGIILAVCSKNEMANAIEPFEKHPEMVLKRSDIACFVANWTDKAANIRDIATQLNIGLDSLVFADDNPAERAIVRRELPMVAVPELPEDPTLWPATLAAAGYFESLRLTKEDLERSGQYQANLQRSNLLASATDIEGYLRSLEMRAIWSRFDRVGQARIVQLINKTNQFNLTTRRVTDEEVAALIEDERALTLQIRLIDSFGDNGIIAIVIGLFQPGTQDIRIDTWLMSCRVLGRRMEETTLNLIVQQARALGCKRLIGVYRPTAKNAMVRDHYPRLGFSATGTPHGDGDAEFVLPLDG
ncbi:MAG TPA: HAD-IIIC family phosphatase, partial [Acetobacteraceae bacterium]|nr:HAD-IIIC family phosphatase [Acetobacteraceae bacterium]